LDSEEIDKLIRGEDLPPLQKDSKDDNPQPLPDHVKKLMEQRKSKEVTPKNDAN
jgi:hypothetical protein